MPTRNSIKLYAEDSFYHVYNRGVEKRNIFLEDYDYRVFLNLLKIYLSPLDEAKLGMSSLFPDKRIRLRKTFYDEVRLMSLCLMPNHFHLLLQQQTRSSMTEFVRAVCTSYSMYFNKKYKRVGGLFQGVYKAVNIENDEYLLHLSRYIHRNPLKLAGCNPANLKEYPYSSYSTYTNTIQRPWIDTQLILDFFTSNMTSPLLSYENFVEMVDERTTVPLATLIIEDED